MASGNLFPLIDVLLQNNAPFVIVGGHAVNFHGYIRTTEDVDLATWAAANDAAYEFAPRTNWI